jgi:hypothetical protein
MPPSAQMPHAAPALFAPMSWGRFVWALAEGKWAVGLNSMHSAKWVFNLFVYKCNGSKQRLKATIRFLKA